jgi:predicted nuclease of predicted toxin-antitoxin system
VKLFIDECLSPQLATRLNRTGRHDAVHPLHVGRRGEPDHRVLQWCIDEDRVILTQNARDFRRLVGGAELHPGLIILAALDREGTWLLLEAVIEYLEHCGEPADLMVNHVLEIDESGAIRFFPLPMGYARKDHGTK